MADNVLCPRCNAKGGVAVKRAKNEKGQDIKYFECTKCKSLWTNSADIDKLAAEGDDDKTAV